MFIPVPLLITDEGCRNGMKSLKILLKFSWTAMVGEKHLQNDFFSILRKYQGILPLVIEILKGLNKCQGI